MKSFLTKLLSISFLIALVSCSDRYQDGFNSGKSQGYNEGYEVGYDDGYADGDADGYERAKSYFESAGYNEGFADGKNEGLSIGYSNGYSVGKNETYTGAYNTGYADGKVDGKVIGYNNGYNDGYDDGWDDGYDDRNAPAYNSGYNAGYTTGEYYGYSSGYSDGKHDGYQSGYSDGDNDGYSLGYDDGWNDAYDIGYDDGWNDAYYSLSVGKTKKLKGYANLLSMAHNDLIDYSKIKAPKNTKRGLIANGKLIFSDESITNKDTLKRAAITEQYLVIEMAKQVQGKFALSAERSLKVAKAANHFRKFSSKRAFTSEDTNAYASEILGVDFKSIEKAYESSLNGNIGSFSTILEKAAEKNETTPENIGVILTKYFM